MTEQEQSHLNHLCDVINRLQCTKHELVIQNQQRENEIAAVKAQLITVESQRQKLESTVLELRGKGNHIESCKTPGTAFRRHGALWQCSCGQTWRLGYGTVGWGDIGKGWQKVTL